MPLFSFEKNNLPWTNEKIIVQSWDEGGFVLMNDRIEYILQQTQNVLAIDSPTGFTSRRPTM